MPGCFPCASGESHEVEPESEQCTPSCFDCASGKRCGLGNEAEQKCTHVEIEQEVKPSTEEWRLTKSRSEELGDSKKGESPDDVHKAIWRAISTLV